MLCVMALSDKHEIFCQEYLIDLNATQAYIRAGYSPDGARHAASRLLTNDNIRARIDELMAERAKMVRIDAAHVVERLKSVAERCMQAEPVMVFNGQFMEHKKDDAGNHIYEFDSNGANKALELLGRHVGMFVDKVDHTSKGEKLPTTINIVLDKGPESFE